MNKSGGLDVEAEERYAEVQKGWASVADWTLEGAGRHKEVQKGRESVADWTLKRM